MKEYAMTDFLIWFYQGFGGLGGWLIFLILGLVGGIFIFAFSAARRIPSVIWRVITLIGFILIIPAVIYRFAGEDVQLSLFGFTDGIFYLGLLAGLLPFILAIGYLIVYHGMVGCGNGHVYDKSLEHCPDCPPSLVITHPRGSFSDGPRTNIGTLTSTDGANFNLESKQKVSAWLVDAEGKSYQLFKVETTIGRSSENDIKFDDKTLGRLHAKIVEEDGHFRLYDFGSINYSRVNGHVIRKPTLIESEDTIQFGDNIHLTFKK
jgi:hypothetical protein